VAETSGINKEKISNFVDVLNAATVERKEARPEVSSQVKNKIAAKKESIKDIISAVAEKDSVVRPYKPAEKKLKEREDELPTIKKEKMVIGDDPVKFFMFCFLGGVFFALGLIAILGLVYGVYLFLYGGELRSISHLFYKFTVLMRALVK
jgi:hypothetical protein